MHITKTVNAEILGKSDRPTRRRLPSLLYHLSLRSGYQLACVAHYRNGPARLERGGVRDTGLMAMVRF